MYRQPTRPGMNPLPPLPPPNLGPAPQFPIWRYVGRLLPLALLWAGLIAFGAVVWATTPRWPVWVTLVTATIAWAAVSGVAYLLVAARHRHDDR